MLSKFESGETAEDSGDRRLLNEIEAISKALYFDKRKPSKILLPLVNARSKFSDKPTFPDLKSKFKHAREDPSWKDKKSSIWNWKPLKALCHSRSHRFNCCFTLQVHSIEKLPSSFNDISLCVHWKRSDEELVTCPSKVFMGIAEFEKKLTYKCSVYGSKSGPHHIAKYEAKHFLLYASVLGVPELDLGKHRVDLTRLLPLTLEELEEETNSRIWTTSYKLSGKGKGATMNVSFGYLVIEDNAHQNAPEVQNLKQKDRMTMKSVTNYGQGDNGSRIRHVESPPKSLSVDERKDLHRVLQTSKSNLTSSLAVLYQKLDEEKWDVATDFNLELGASTEKHDTKPDLNLLSDFCQEHENECEDNEFSVIDQGVETSYKEHFNFEEATVLNDGPAQAFPAKSPECVKIDNGVGLGFEGSSKVHMQVTPQNNAGNKLALHDLTSTDSEFIMEESEPALTSISNLEIASLEFPEEHENDLGVESNFTHRKGKSHSLDSIASAFLTMQGIEHSPFGLSSESDPESPREHLLRQFEKDTLGGGSSIFDFDIAADEQGECGYSDITESGWGDLSDTFGLASIIQAAEEEHQMDIQEAKSKMRAKQFEDMERESLTHEVSPPRQTS